MTYFKLVFFGAFLPVTMILYQLMVKKYRWVILLLSSLVFFLTFGRKVIVYLILAAGITYGIGRLLESIDAKSKQLVKDLKKSDASSEEIRAEKSKIKSKYKRRGRAALVLGIIAVLSMLLYLKYYNFFIERRPHVSTERSSQPMNERSRTNAFHFWPSIIFLLSANASSLLISGLSASMYGIIRYS